jgi:hypothetical protein
MASKKHVAAAAYTFLELQNMYFARLVCHADSSSIFQTKLCDTILHDTIDIQKREDASRCSSYVELVVPNYNFNEFRQHFRLTLATFDLRPFYQKQTNFWTSSGSCFDLKYGSPMFRMFRKPVSVLDEKSNKPNM